MLIRRIHWHGMCHAAAFVHLHAVVTGGWHGEQGL